MKKIIFATLILTIISYASILAQPSYGKGNFGQKCIEGLNLDDAQEKQFNNFRYEHKQKVIDMRAEIEKNKLEIRKMMVDNEINASKLRELTKTNSGIKENIHSSRVDMWLNIYNILNKDQQEVWTKHFSRMGKGKRHGKHMGRHSQGKRFQGRGYDGSMQRRYQNRSDIDE